MKRTSLVILVVIVIGLLNGCNSRHDRQLPNGTKIFGERSLKDGTKEILRIEHPDGVKHFDVAELPNGTQKSGRIESPDGVKQFDVEKLPDGTYKYGRIESPNGQKDFDVVELPDRTVKFGRIEYPNGQKQFDVVMLPDGTRKFGRIEFPNGEKRFDETWLPDGTRKVGRIEHPNGDKQFNVISESPQKLLEGSKQQAVLFKTDPKNSLPVYTLEEVEKTMDSRHGLAKLRGLLRIRTQIKHLGNTSVTSMYSPRNFQYDWFEFQGFGDADLDPLSEGDTVEIVCEFVIGRAIHESGYAGMRYFFRGVEIHKAQ